MKSMRKTWENLTIGRLEIYSASAYKLVNSRVKNKYIVLEEPM
jgi:hypothetical protein